MGDTVGKLITSYLKRIELEKVEKNDDEGIEA